MKMIDTKTVNLLEGLAPGVSAADGRRVTGLVLSGDVFEEFSEDERQGICQRLLSYKGRIPSFRLFFQDVLFLELGARRVKKLVDKRTRFSHPDINMDGDQGRKQSLREKMEHMFHQPDTGGIMIQTSDGQERQVSGDGEFQFDLAYRQVWLCALRSSSGSPGEGNKPATVRRSWTHPHEQYKLAQLASALGFRSDSISQLTSRPFEPEHPPWYEFDDDRNPKLKRCGVPYAITFREDRKTLFLDQIHQETPECEELDSAFILHDIYISFFGDLLPSVFSNYDTPGMNSSRAPTPEPTCIPTANRPTSPSASHQQTTPPQSQAPDTSSQTASNGQQGTSGPSIDRPNSSRAPTPEPTRIPTANRPTSPSAPHQQTASNGQQGTSGPSIDRPNTEESRSRRSISPAGSNRSSTSSPKPTTTSEETRDWHSELEAVTNDLRKLQEDLNGIGIQFDNPTIADQENAVSDLYKPLGAPIPTDRREELEALQAEVSKRRKDILGAKARIHIASSEVESEIRQLAAFTLNAEGTPEGEIAASQVLLSAQAVLKSSNSVFQRVDTILNDIVSQIQPLGMRISSMKLLLLGYPIQRLVEELKNCFANIDTVKKSVADLNTNLDPSNWPPSQESDIQSLNVIRSHIATKVSTTLKELDAIPLFHKDPGKLTQTKRESLLDNSVAKVEQHKAEAERTLLTSREQIKDVKDRLQNEYARAILARKEEIQARLDSEHMALERLTSDHKDIDNSIENFHTFLTTNLNYLEQIIEHNTQERLSQPINVDELDGIFRSIQTMKEAHRTSVSYLQNSTISQELPLEMQVKICGEYEEIQGGINQRKEEEAILLERLERQRKNTQDFAELMAKTMESAASSLLKEVQLKSSETTRQLKVVMEAESLTAAKSAMELTKQAAAECSHFAGLVLTGTGLVDKEGGPADLHAQLQKKASEATNTSQQAHDAAAAGQQFVSAWVEVDMKMENFAKTAEMRLQKSTDLSKTTSKWTPMKGQDFAKRAVEAMSIWAFKSYAIPEDMQREIRPILDKVHASYQTRIAKIANLRVPEIEETTKKTLTGAFDLFYDVTKKLDDHAGSEMKAIDNFKTLADESIRSKDKDRWLAIVHNAEKAKGNLDKDVVLAKWVNAKADRLKSAIDSDGVKRPLPELAIEYLKKMRECLQRAEDNEAKALEMLQEIESSWSKGLAAREQERASAECSLARDAIGEIQPHHSFNDAEIARNAFKAAEDLFEVTTKALKECRGPAERFEEIAGKFTDVTVRAKSATKCAEAVLGRVESCQFNKAKRTPSDLEVTDMQTKWAATPVEHPAGDQSTLQNNSTGKRSRIGKPSRNTIRTQSKHIYLFIIKTFDGKLTTEWERESHYIGKGKAFEKGQELCGRGKLYGLNRESSRLGLVNASGFEDAIVERQKIFFLAAEGELTGISSDELLKKAQECEEKCRSVPKE
ncbi:hypothetical protein CNMCM5793_005720 [Aspergillus hiratsukae]|uniref:Uncharacterized protein n=1 Tax=Aspergillus hiratsukae TaxID=1194566 RepID=A0A8H6PGF0_9EURO|nr:hypothetical protein CNMCM5793_005720 [Aspergillus hiratsukae]KAF7172101.1 hypothetical protein CNMCM6106_006379 [Aspergillus hiratsukae]